MPELHVLRVFTDESGAYGNPLGVFLDGGAVPEERRQAVAHDIGFSETVFVDDLAAGRCRIFTPGLELEFAGHPMVGMAWLLAEEGAAPDVLRPPAGEIGVRREDGLTYVAARAEWSPPWEMVELHDPGEVDRLTGVMADEEIVFYWSWLDRDAGTVRARCYSMEDGIGEDEATGSAAIMLAAELDQGVTIRQGLGSLLYAAPLGEGRAEVGGRVVLDEVRDYAVE